MDDIIRNIATLVEPESLQTSVSYRIRLLQIAAYKNFEAKVQGFGTAPRYFGMLKIIQANPGIPQSRLAEAIFLDRSSLVPILDALTKEGWVERRQDDRDKRVRLVHLTDSGARRLTVLEQEVEAHERAMADGLSASEREQLLRLLGKIDTNLRRAQEEHT